MENSENVPSEPATTDTMQAKLKYHGRYCCVPHCHNIEQDRDGKKISMHRIPSESARPLVRKLWLDRLKNVRSNLIVSSNTRVCAEHFEEYHKGENIGSNSVPTIFPPKPRKEHRIRPFNSWQLNAANSTLVSEDVILPCDQSQCVDILVQGTSTNTGTQCGESFFTHSHITFTQTAVEMKDVAVQFNGPDVVFEDIKDSDEKVRFYTGFVNLATFMCMFTTLVKHGAGCLTYWRGEKKTLTNNPGGSSTGSSRPGPKRLLRVIDEFLLVCMRFRLGVLQAHLSDIFHVSETTVSEILNTWVNYVYDHSRSLIAWPTREQILNNLPKAFINYQNARVVVDCTEFYMEKPSVLSTQWLTWSDYKHSNTFKLLVGVSPSGMVTFLSRLWGGHSSDRHITQEDGLLPLLEPGDNVMADKGFTVADLLPKDVTLNMPPFLKKGTQLSNDQFFNTQSIASARIVVEMKMEQIKNYRILQGIIPLNEAHLAEQMVFICAAWTNLLPPLLL